MPTFDNVADDAALLKLLLIGDGRIGKTHYTVTAAKAGLNLLYLDGDVGGATIQQMRNKGELTPEELRRIFYIDCRDTVDAGQRDSRFWDTIAEFIAVTNFKWNDTEGRLARIKDVNCTIAEILPYKLDSNTLLVIDGWTALIESIVMAVARAHKVNLLTATTSQMRPVYQMSAVKATEILRVIRSVKCHVVVMAHPDEYEHRTAPQGQKVETITEKDMVVDWTKLIPKSTSKPHGMQLPKYFTDVGWLTVSPAGHRRLDFKQMENRVGGGNLDGVHDLSTLTFPKLLQMAGVILPAPSAIPPATESWLRLRDIGDEPAVAESKVLGEQPIPTTGMSSLFKKG